MKEVAAAASRVVFFAFIRGPQSATPNRLDHFTWPPSLHVRTQHCISQPAAASRKRFSLISTPRGRSDLLMPLLQGTILCRLRLSEMEGKRRLGPRCNFIRVHVIVRSSVSRIHARLMIENCIKFPKCEPVKTRLSLYECSYNKTLGHHT